MMQNIIATQMIAAAVAFAGLAGPANAAAGSALTQPTPVQATGVDKALGSAPALHKADVTAAMPTLRPYIVTLMCVQDDTATRGLIQKFVGSRGKKSAPAAGAGSRTEKVFRPA